MGSPFSQVQGAYEEKAHPRDRGLEEKPDCGFGLTISTCIRIFPNFNICCIRVKHLNSCNFEYIVEFIVSMYYEYRCGPKWPYYSCDLISWIY